MGNKSGLWCAFWHRANEFTPAEYPRLVFLLKVTAFDWREDTVVLLKNVSLLLLCANTICWCRACCCCACCCEVETFSVCVCPPRWDDAYGGVSVWRNVFV
jgi:hypothetical protein